MTGGTLEYKISNPTYPYPQNTHSYGKDTKHRMVARYGGFIKETKGFAQSQHNTAFIHWHVELFLSPHLQVHVTMTRCYPVDVPNPKIVVRVALHLL